VLPKNRHKAQHLIEIFGETNHGIGISPLQKMITPIGRIYGEIIGLPSFGTEELARVQFSWELQPSDPRSDPYVRYENSFGPFDMLIHTSFETGDISSQIRKAAVIVVRFTKRLPI
jgi:hypothetical protein